MPGSERCWKEAEEAEEAEGHTTIKCCATASGVGVWAQVDGVCLYALYAAPE